MDKSKKKLLKRYLLWAGLASLVLVLTVMPMLAQNEAESDGPKASLLSAEVEVGSITTSIRGGGNLEDQDDQDVNIPTDVKITEFLVKNGDVVTKGTPLATVDRVSVMTAITSVNETLDYIQEKLEDSRDEEISGTVTATPGGRVKKIYAREGESAQEVMLRDGCLAVLSIDSMMAVDFEVQSSLETGESLDVALADGTAVSGRVESNLNGTVVVTVDDEGYEIGQTVTVKDLGTGELYIHNAWKATAYSGTVSKVNVKEEQVLNAGAKLFALEDLEFTGQLQYRANQHREYEELLQTLLQIYESGTIDAPCDGIVSGVEEDSVHLLATEDATWTVELLDNTTNAPNYKIVFLSGEVVTECTGKADCTAEEHTVTPHECVSNSDISKICPGTSEHKDNCLQKCSRAHSDGVEQCPSSVHYPDCVANCTAWEECPAENHHSGCITHCISSNTEETCPAEVHKSSCIESCEEAKTIDQTCPADSHHHKSGCIHRCDGTDGCTAEIHKSDCYYNGVTYSGYVVLVDYYAPQDGGIGYSTSGATYTGESFAAVKNAAMAALKGMTYGTYVDTNIGAGLSINKNDVVLIAHGYKGSEVVDTKIVVLVPGGNTGTGGQFQGGNGFGMSDWMGSMDMSGMMSGMDLSGMSGMSGMDMSGITGGFSGYGSYSFSGGSSTADTETLHDLDGSTLMTVTPHKTMELSITVDEQDISKISVGMEATVKVEALKNQEFTAKVTKVGTSGTNNGGSSKFTVTLQLDAVEDMLPGMSASADIPLETRENVRKLPVEAVCEQDGKTVVCTALSEDGKSLGTYVEVTIGVSDGETVEILSGLNEGDKVYYTYYDTLEEDTSAQASRFTFG